MKVCNNSDYSLYVIKMDKIVVLLYCTTMSYLFGHNKKYFKCIMLNDTSNCFLTVSCQQKMLSSLACDTYHRCIIMN